MDKFLLSINYLSRKHFEKNAVFRALANHVFCSVEANSLEEVPFVPISFFKRYQLSSVDPEDIHKVMHSSGTGGVKSKVFIDKRTAILQSKILRQIGSKIMGSGKSPMLVFDSLSTRVGAGGYGARSAAINGFRAFASKQFFMVDANGGIDVEGAREFLEASDSEDFIIFGFTFVIWEILEKLDQLAVKKPLSLASFRLVHGGGWKKLQHLGVSEVEFANKVKQWFPVASIVNYYGMIEQVGSIFFECQSGFYHESDFSRVIIRDPNTLTVRNDGEIGLLQLLSVVPESYPGHSILSEDLGMFQAGICSCGDKHKRFKVLGRYSSSELRGCSDAM